MTDLGIIYSQMDAAVINTVNQIIQDALAEAQNILNPNYKLSYRNISPQDETIGSATFTWNNTFNTVASEKMCGTATVTKVPTRQALVHFGWYVDTDFGKSSRVYIEINGKTRNQIDAQTVWEQPGHILLTPDRVLFAKENDLINFYLYNGLGVNTNANVAPLAIAIGEASILGID